MAIQAELKGKLEGYKTGAGDARASGANRTLIIMQHVEDQTVFADTVALKQEGDSDRDLWEG